MGACFFLVHRIYIYIYYDIAFLNAGLYSYVIYINVECFKFLAHLVKPRELMLLHGVCHVRPPQIVV